MKCSPTVSRALRETGYAVDVVNDGQQADAALSTQECDLLILDLGLPKMSGLGGFASRARASHVPSPVLILTAADSVEQRSGLGFGADDYMAKPFSLHELLARAGAHAPPSGFWPKPNSVGQFEF